MKRRAFLSSLGKLALGAAAAAVITTEPEARARTLARTENSVDVAEWVNREAFDRTEKEFLAAGHSALPVPLHIDFSREPYFIHDSELRLERFVNSSRRSRCRTNLGAAGR